MILNKILSPIYPIIYLHEELNGPTTDKINNAIGKKVVVLEEVENVEIFPGRKETAIKIFVDNKIGWTLLSHYKEIWIWYIKQNITHWLFLILF